MIRKALAACWFGMGAAAAGIHLLTYLGIDATSWWPSLWVFHFLAIAGGVFTLASGNVPPTLDRSNAWASFDAPRADPPLAAPGRNAATSAADEEHAMATRFRPSRAKAVATLLACYAAINFFACLAILQGGVPGERGSEYVLTAHGKTLAALSRSEYDGYRAVQTRLFTGHWLLFFFLAGSFWWMPPAYPFRPDEPLRKSDA